VAHSVDFSKAGSV